MATNWGPKSAASVVMLDVGINTKFISAFVQDSNISTSGTPL